MAKVYQQLSDCIGNTPLLRLERYERFHQLQTNIIVKLEYFNPLGSAKDRVARAMIEQAIADGQVNNSTMIIEPTSGNTGVGLAMICAEKGLHLILTMPETMSIERRRLLAALGAELVLTDGAKGMSGAIEKAHELKRSHPNAFIPSQFDNPANPKAHRETTGPEIWRDTDGQIDAFVAGIGTGGTITGVGELLKQHNAAIQIIGVEPVNSAVLSGGQAGPHPIQGIGAGFVPSVLRTELLDEIIPVTGEGAYQTVRELARLEGLLVGISSGAAVFAATALAKRPAYRGKTIVALLPDSGERYLSVEGLFE